MKKIAISNFIVLLASLLWQSAAFAQATTVRGVIKDIVTGETLPYVTVTVPGTTIGNSADDDGRYIIKFTGSHTKLRFNFIGYIPVEVDVVPGKDQLIDIEMDVNQDMLDAVVVEGKRGRY